MSNMAFAPSRHRDERRSYKVLGAVSSVEVTKHEMIWTPESSMARASDLGSPSVESPSETMKRTYFEPGGSEARSLANLSLIRLRHRHMGVSPPKTLFEPAIPRRTLPHRSASSS